MPLPSQPTPHLVHFDVHLTASDLPTDRRRWNGDPMPSREASDALHAGVEAFQAALRVRGFEVARTGYGVHATEDQPDA